MEFTTEQKSSRESIGVVMSQVVIGDILPYTQATAILNQVIFMTNWTADDESDVVVYVTPVGDDPDDETQILSYPSQYSVAFIGASEEVQVTLVTPSDAGDIVTITRQTPADRMNLYTNTNFLPSMLNNDFGILTLVDQQAQLVDQLIGPRYNYSAVIAPNLSFPNANIILPILGANQTWVKNPADTAIIVYDLPQNGIAPADATYVTITDETSVLPNSVNFVGKAAGVVSYQPAAGGSFLTHALTGTALEIGVLNGTGIGGAPTFFIASNPHIPGTAGMGIPAGTTAQRVTPTGTSIGLRYNTTIESLEYFDGVTWVQLEDSTDLSTLLAMLASHAAGEGASLIGLETPSTSTVQDLSEADFYVLTTPNDALPNAIAFDPADYLPLAGGTMSGVINMGNNIISNLPAPTNGGDSTNKTYVDNLIQNVHIAVLAASTTALTVTYNNGTLGVGATLTNAGAMAAFSLDGVSPTVAQRVLIKNQASQFQNGVYTVTTVGSGAVNWVLTRATDYDEAADMQAGDKFAVVSGTTQAATEWMMTQTAAITVGTTAITFTEMGHITSSITAVVRQVFTANDTYTPTPGMVFCIAELVAGGGAGGGSAGTAGQAGAGGGGGGGAYASGVFTAADIGASKAVTIGAGGTVGAAGNVAGNNGGVSSLGALLTANGGAGGAGSASTAGAAFGGARGLGGTTGSGSFVIGGGLGGAGIVVLGSAGVAMPGPGGGSQFAPTKGGNRGSPSAGIGYGGGGDGGYATSANVTGFAGAPGVCAITEFLAL